MIRHIVMWKVRGASDAERFANIERVRQSFVGLRDRIPGMTALEIGVDVSGVDYACDVVLLTEFESQVALDAYARHPAHLRARDELSGIRVERHQVDFIVDQGNGAASVVHP